ncbi:uncharacterized protein KY384_000482 [Bacidia gigantensis]|uniref:uncharacterized protein n=1 Tax=Bacidia gigantensis TaxID=2732470 RepID=UPI001D045AC4|nr:uncharacterized protein KY384_000482 [Bacidia gigantensis]KAG8525722.1 hypothetical protein KY384_000482 [Bacidia gigantensis]
MNTRPAIADSESPISLSVSFNQDASCFSVGLDTGFCVFNSEPCELKVSRDFNAGVGAAEMLGRANYLALVGGGRQPKFPQNKILTRVKVTIWDDNKQQGKFTLEFRSPVLRARISRSRIIVALQNSTHIYRFSAPPEKLSVFETADNPLGLCCLGSELITFPGRSIGQVQMVEISTGNVSIIPAHSTALRAMELSPDGEILATASETGTLVRTFYTRNSARMGELRRGVDHAFIYSIAISPNGKQLAVTSDKGTLHIFDLPGASSSRNSSRTRGRPHKDSNSGINGNEEVVNQKWGVLGKIPLLPRVFSDTYSVTSAQFEVEDNPNVPFSNSNLIPIPGIPGGKPQKGIIGWKDDHTILVLGAGRDGRWEKFILGEVIERIGRALLFNDKPVLITSLILDLHHLRPNIHWRTVNRAFSQQPHMKYLQIKGLHDLPIVSRRNGFDGFINDRPDNRLRDLRIMSPPPSDVSLQGFPIRMLADLPFLDSLTLELPDSSQRMLDNLFRVLRDGSNMLSRLLSTFILAIPPKHSPTESAYRTIDLSDFINTTTLAIPAPFLYWDCFASEVNMTRLPPRLKKLQLQVLVRACIPFAADRAGAIWFVNYQIEQIQENLTILMDWIGKGRMKVGWLGIWWSHSHDTEPMAGDSTIEWEKLKGNLRKRHGKDVDTIECQELKDTPIVMEQAD